MTAGPLRAFIRRRLSRDEALGLSFTVSFLVCAGLAVAFAVLAHEVREDAGRADAFDLRVSEALYELRSPPLTAAMLGVTFLGDHRFLLVATPAVAAAFWLARRHVFAAVFVLSVLGGLGLNILLKIAVARARPDRWPALVTESSPSFPSGHTLMSAVFFGSLAATVVLFTRRPAPRILAISAATVLVLAVACSRVYLGAHWATDTLAGMLAGTFWVLVYSATTASVTRVRDRRLAEKQGG